MNSGRVVLGLEHRWSCSFYFKKTSSGRYAGVAEITFGGIPSGNIVVMQQPSVAAAIARIRLRANQFVRERTPVVNIQGAAETDIDSLT